MTGALAVTRADLRVPVGATLGLPGDTEQAAWLFVPPPGVAPVALLVVLPGASYDKRYYHLEVPGHPGYSLAEHLARRGIVVAAVDHLGTGESSDPTGVATADSTLLARGDAVVVEQLRERLRAGTLHPDLAGPLDLPVLVGGHSMGAALAVLMQAAHPVADGLVVLGYAVEITNLGGTDPMGQDLSERVRHSREILAKRFGIAPTDPFFTVPREHVRQLFFSPDTPEEVVAADVAASTRVPLATAAEVGAPGFVREAVAGLTVPLFFAFGGVDTCPDPLSEPAHYRSATDVTLRVYPAAHHCINSSGSRLALFDDVADWIVGRFGGRRT